MNLMNSSIFRWVHSIYQVAIGEGTKDSLKGWRLDEEETKAAPSVQIPLPLPVGVYHGSGTDNDTVLYVM